MIMHIDMDAFFASIEQAINPILRGKPLIVGSRANKYNTVVCAASYEAKRLGIDSGMPTTRAFQLCPNALFVVAESSKYTYVSEEIFKMLKDYNVSVEHYCIDEFDLYFPDSQPESKAKILTIAKSIKQRIKNTFNITCSIGIAPNWYLAKIGSKIGKPDGLIYMDKSNYLNIINDLPVEKICGIGPNLSKQLNELGIITCGQLLQYPKNLLVERFGKIGSWMSQCLNPNYYTEILKKESTIPKSISHSYTLPKETQDIQLILSWLRMLSETISNRLRRLNLEAKTICVQIANSIQQGLFKRKTFQQGFWLGYDIFRCAKVILDLKNGYKISARIVRISVSNLGIKLQTPLFENEIKKEILYQKVGQINDKFGEWTIYPAIIKLISEIPKDNETPK